MGCEKLITFIGGESAKPNNTGVLAGQFKFKLEFQIHCSSVDRPTPVTRQLTKMTCFPAQATFARLRTRDTLSNVLSDVGSRPPRLWLESRTGAGSFQPRYSLRASSAQFGGRCETLGTVELFAQSHR